MSFGWGIGLDYCNIIWLALVIYRHQTKAGVAIFISDKIEFKTKAMKRDKEGQYIMIKGSIQEEDITVINIYAPNIGAWQYVRQMPTSVKGELTETQ